MNLVIGMILLLVVTWLASRRDPRSEADDLGLTPLRAEDRRDARRRAGE